MKKQETPILDFIDGFIKNAESLLFAIPFLIFTFLGTLVKLFFLSLLSLLTLNHFVKIKNLWNQKFLISNIGNPWNCLITIVVFLFLINII